MNLTKKFISRAMNARSSCRKYSHKSFPIKKKAVEMDDPSLIRNIGILAHIDAGKTTTTERMLFYSGTIGQMGEVHHGNTVTDFMDQERERGITITSASVTFQWRKHKINLLDTPGHIDFTMEVEQTLNVMDGAIIILDGSAGVEAQTITVWKQADRHRIPRMIYVNKMDKPSADFFRSVHSVQDQLQVTPLVLQLPVMGEFRAFDGIIDLLTLEKCTWQTPVKGISYSQKILTSEDGKLWEDAMNARIKLTETLADLDDKMAEIIILDEKKLEAVSSSVLRESIRKVTCELKGMPVLCGSSYRNVGVELLMDSVIYYLPSPINNQSGKIMECFGNNLCAKAFKVRHDEHKGPVTFFRIYSGNLSKGQKIYNVKREKPDHCGKLYVAYADDYEEVSEIGPGNIAAVTGLKFTTSGELVTSSATAFKSGLKAINSLTDSGSNENFSGGALIPDPVFFCSIEAPSPTHQANLEKALSELEREDPSLRVSFNNETGQTVLGGMGQLHLEVIKERIRKDYKIDVDTGPLQIAYKETLVEDVKDSYKVHHKIGDSEHWVSLTMSALVSDAKDSGRLLLDRSPDSVNNISSIFPKHLLAVKNGLDSAFQSGPKLMCPVANVKVMLHHLEVGRGTSETIIASTVSQCIRKLLKQGGVRLLEPVMLVEIVCRDDLVDGILNDLAKRRAEMESTGSRGKDMVIRALVPLSELMDYATQLRILSSGRATFTMEFHSLRKLSTAEEAKAVKSVTGIS